ncbi:uncharacterized protein LOC110615186 isoform X4 [Manihot esculenta]|uniref:uncharacterized protein LOC110615186 isoform X4 n=1 Tax=Manihot esculenta TaxID=3983 RepID=UPI001CC6B2AF|nr:uncharacterized protein LOC110615186 isoform X4 [Manihot esculenta]
MGSLESALTLKRDSLLRSASAGRSERYPFLLRPRSRFSRFLLSKKLDYLQWICMVAVFLFFVVIFQMFLPGSVIEKSQDSIKLLDMVSGDLLYLKQMGSFDFGEDIKFEPLKLMEKFEKEAREVNVSSTFNITQHRFGYRKPQLALVFADLLADPQQLLMVTVATALQEIGYTIQVFSVEDGPAHAIWTSIGVPVSISPTNNSMEIAVDWLIFDGILVNSLEAKVALSCFMQEPFKSIPLIWTIHERILAVRSRQYTANGQIALVNDWKRYFNRATVVVFPNYFLPVDDRVNGFLFPKENIGVLTEIVMQVISNGKLSPLASNVASLGKGAAKNLMVAETLEGYASLLGKVIKFPSEVSLPKAFVQIPSKLKEEWRWHLFGPFFNLTYGDRTLRSSRFLDKVEEQWNHSYGSITSNDESFSYEIWKEEKENEILNVRKRREEEELKDRSDQPHGTWEEVYRGAKRADRSRNDLHERDEGELERTGQPLCIYEPYFGQGTWSFLHLSSLYRGVGLSTKGRRPGTDDVDGPSRLPLLSNPYYRDILGEYGAFFAIANRIDRIHKNAWIGFQSWRATARKASLSRTAEKALLDAIQTRRHEDTLYFWVRMDMDPRNQLQQDFWSFCDAINAGNCKSAFSEAFRNMYGVEQNLDYLPPMPGDGDTWSVMLSWALPTRSFLEFVMFSRMFVDALDAHMYDAHHQSGHCYLSLSKDKHCYSRVLELLINVWAYHSARHMVYINPETGLMQEQHKMKSRRGKMWVKWFSYTTLKSMDEDLAEEADSDHPKRRWLWPSTGEVIWQGVFEKERNLRNRQKEKKKQQSKDKLSRMRRKRHQKVIGKYVKPPPEDIDNSNSTTLTSVFL